VAPGSWRENGDASSRARVASVEYGAHVRPRVGWPGAGDTAIARLEDGKLLATIVDVLGHGTEAHALTKTIESFLNSRASSDPMSAMAALHQHLKRSLGAAVGLCELDLESGELDYVGVGNTVLRRFGGQEQRLISTPGVVGGIARSPQSRRLRVQAGDVVLLYTDGIRDHFQLQEYPQLLTHDTLTIARTVVERFGKAHDDSACLALRYER